MEKIQASLYRIGITRTHLVQDDFGDAEFVDMARTGPPVMSYLLPHSSVIYIIKERTWTVCVKKSPARGEPARKGPGMFKPGNRSRLSDTFRASGSIRVS